MKERIIGLLTIATVIVVLSFIYLKGDGLAEIEQRIEARQSVTVEEARVRCRRQAGYAEDEDRSDVG